MKWLCVLCVTIATSGPLRAQEGQHLSYQALVLDAGQISHFETRSMTWGPAGDGTRFVTPMAEARQIGFARFPAGYTADWHAAPRAQFLFIMQGTMRIEAGDGERKEFGPGQMLLVLDLKGRGHRMSSVGRDELVMSTLSVP